MRADENIDFTFQGLEEGVVLLRFGAEAAHHINPNREGRHALDERIVVLLSQNSGGNQYCHLHPVHDRFKCGAHGHFGFSEPHITTEQAIHWAQLFHVAFQFLRGGQLIGCFGVRKGRFEFGLHGRVFRKAVTALGLPLGLGQQELRCKILNGFFGSGFVIFPFAAAEGVGLGACLPMPL